MNDLLLGLRGSGKTTVGRLLAARRSRPFVDLDERTLTRFAEPTVSAIWAAHGEDAWREAEVQALRETLAADEQIVALGGGTPMIAEVQELLRQGQEGGQVRLVYLRCSAQRLHQRLAGALGDRPSLTGGDPTGEIQEVLAQRDPVYLDLADHVCEVSDRTAGQVVDWLEESLW